MDDDWGYGPILMNLQIWTVAHWWFLHISSLWYSIATLKNQRVPVSAQYNLAHCNFNSAPEPPTASPQPWENGSRIGGCEGHWIGWRENLKRKPWVLPWYMGVSSKFARKPTCTIPWEGHLKCILGSWLVDSAAMNAGVPPPMTSWPGPGLRC